MGNDAFAEVASLLFGDGAAELVAKSNPDGADLSAGEQKRRKKQAQIGLASNVVGITAGVAGTAAALRDERFKDGGKVARKLYRVGQRIPKPISGKGGRTGAALAGGALGLQLGNLAGDAVANRVLSREAKRKVHKRRGLLIAAGSGSTAAGGFALGSATEIERKKHRLRLVASPQQAKKELIRAGGAKAEEVVVPAAKGQYKKLDESAKKKLAEQVAKSDVIEVSKLDEDKRQIFGWASVVEKNGQPVVDLQGDFIPVEEMEKSAYNYVRKSRQAGDMHRRAGDSPFVVGEMIESFALTPEKKAAMGLPDSMPSAWWVGFQIEDEQVWSDIKSGKRKGFSVHGTGRREAL